MLRVRRLVAVLRYEAPPADYPLIYDKSMANHSGRGINVCTVQAGIFWDKDAKWLKAFAVAHPEYKIPIPE